MINKIYIAHLDKLTDRKNYINSILDSPFFKDRTFVSVATEEKDLSWILNNSYNPNLSTRIEYCKVTPLKKQEICFQEQMLEIYSEIADSEDGLYLILEDDFQLSSDFEEKCNEVFFKIPKDADCCFLGSCCNLFVPDECEQEFWPNEYSRCGIAYTITPNFCKKIIQAREYYMPTDWNLTFVKDLFGGKFYWSKTILFNQGSEGIYNSNIR